MESMEPAVLRRELYTIGEAARLLSTPDTRLPSQTLKRWLEGHWQRGVFYEPVLRAEPTGSDLVTWAEFVEAGLLKEYRKRDVPLQRLRPMIVAMREAFGVPYPLAHFRPLIDPDSKELVLRLQEQLKLEKSLYLVVRRGGSMQGLLFSESVAAYLQRVEFDEHAVAARVRPLGPASAVVIDPDRAFGAPTIRGIRTEILFEHFQADEPIDQIAEDFDLTRHDVEEAIRWESRAA